MVSPSSDFLNPGSLDLFSSLSCFHERSTSLRISGTPSNTSLLGVLSERLGSDPNSNSLKSEMPSPSVSKGPSDIPTA